MSCCNAKGPTSDCEQTSPLLAYRFPDLRLYALVLAGQQVDGWQGRRDCRHMYATVQVLQSLLVLASYSCSVSNNTAHNITVFRLEAASRQARAHTSTASKGPSAELCSQRQYIFVLQTLQITLSQSLHSTQKAHAVAQTCRLARHMKLWLTTTYSVHSKT
jgi:hypothetical protein